MTRVAVIGSTGQLGGDVVGTLQKTESYVVFPFSHAEVECTQQESVRTALAEVRPDVVINCAAYVDVDGSEESPEKAFAVNTLGAFRVARACAEFHSLCVYISTDYVFGGGKQKAGPYNENDTPNPLNVYGTSKLAGELLVGQTSPRWLIIRLASLFGKTGARGKHRTFVESILSQARAGTPMRVVNDIRMSPTYTLDAARRLEQLIHRGATGIFHLTNEGSCTWYEFARAALDILALKADIVAISSHEYPTRARRPADSSLNSVRLAGFQIASARPWFDALEAYLIEKGYK